MKIFGRLLLALALLNGSVHAQTAQSQTTISKLPVAIAVNPQTDYTVGIVRQVVNGQPSFGTYRVPLSVLVGPAGPPSALSIGTVTGLPSGASPTASLSGQPPNQVLNLGLAAGPVGPAGPTGSIGPAGPQGVQGPAGQNGTGAGSVTSVAVAVPPDETVTGSPVTSSGTFTISRNSQGANTVLAGPSSGGNAAPSYRGLVAADVPPLPYTTTAQAAAAAPVQSVAGRTGAVTLGVADVSGAAPLASPALTGTPTVPTAAPGTNSTQAASTAFVLANASGGGFPVTGTSAKSAAYTLGSTTGDTGKVFVLTGSFPLTLPAASGGSATSPLWFHYSKRDGSGACTLVLSGSDTWEDGTTAAKFVYQESGTLVSLGGGVWRFAPGTRQRGKVFAGSYTVASGAAAVNIPLGFGDPDAVNVLLDIFNFLQSGTSGGQLTLSLAQGGSTATLSSSVTVSSASNTTRNAGALTLRNVSATAAYMTTVQTAYSNTTTSVTSAGAITSATLTPGSGPISSMTYNVWVDRS